MGIGFAVPSNTVRDVIPRLERGETIKRAYLGVSTSAGTGRVTVAAVTAGGPAATAGLQVGDVIMSVGGKRVSDPGRRRGRDPGPPPGRAASRSRSSAAASSETLKVKLGERPATGDAMTFQSPWLLLGLLLLPLLARGLRRDRAAPAPRRGGVRGARRRARRSSRAGRAGAATCRWRSPGSRPRR